MPEIRNVFYGSDNESDFMESEDQLFSDPITGNYCKCKVECEQPVNFNNKDEHDKTNHVIINCSNCQLMFEKYLLEDHLKNGCPDRKVKCQICDIELKAADITEHENYCGSRTEKCSNCGEFVMLKYRSLHLDSNHAFVKLSDEPGPSPLWQYGQRTLCNFMPDLSLKTSSSKPASVCKIKSNEHTRKSRHSGSSVYREDLDESDRRNIDSPCSEEGLNSCDNYHQIYNTFGLKNAKKSTQKDVEWPALSSLRSLQISEQNNIPSGSQVGNSSQVNEDLMYALQVSHELNSDIWRKDINREDESVKNCYKPSVKNESSAKFLEKNIFEKKQKKFTDFKLNALKNDFNYLHDKNESVKIPCEFCGTLVVSNDLFIHQSRCSLYMTEGHNLSSEKYKTPYFDDDIEKKIACGVCNKFYRLSLFENHLLHCQKTPSKSAKYKMTSSKNLKAVNMNMKCEQGLQNGLEPNSPQLTRMGTKSQWLTEFSKNCTEAGKDIQNNLNHPEPEKGFVAKTTKVSRKNRRAPSPPRR